MIWGFAGPWYGQFLMRDGEHIKDEGERFWARFEFLRRWGLQTMGQGLRQIDAMADEDRDRLGALLSDYDIRLVPRVQAPYLEDDEDALRRAVDDIARGLERYAGLLRAPLVTTGLGRGHRFDRRLPWEERMERLRRSLTPVAAAIHAAGLPFGVENHGDYYISDLAELCRQVPHLGIFLDTGNTYLIGEKPLPAFAEAAPYTVGTHFKDHRVAPRPDGRPLNFEINGSPLGEGDVPLRECYRLLKERAPDPGALVMEIEMIAPDGMHPEECLEHSLRFIRSLDEEAEA